MKWLDVTLKDLRQSTRSMIAIVFMFVVPVLVTVLFWFLFGGLGGGPVQDIEVPRTAVIVVNQDQGNLPAGSAPAQEQAQSFGAILIATLQDESLRDLVQVTEATDPGAARAAVDRQQAGVAVILPPGFTDALISPAVTATVELYRDPTLTIGPGIVEAIVRQIIDGFAGAKVGTGVALQQLAEAGIAPSAELGQQIAAQVSAAAQNQNGASALAVTRPPSGVAEPTSQVAGILGVILGGMMVLYAFYTGAATLESILTEEEKGTLARLFTTPTPVRAILGGKMVAALVALVVQVTLLLLFGWLVFGIHWGELLPVAMAAIGIVLLAASAGVFIVSLLRNTRQGGVVYGGVLTLTGMVGLISVFTGGSVNLPPSLVVASLLVPQGWAMRGLQTAMDGGSAADVGVNLLVILVWCAVFVGIGLRRLQRRFA